MLLPILIIHVSEVVMETYITLFESAVRYSYSPICFAKIVCIRASWTMATSFPRFVYYGSCIIGKIVNCQANVITLFWEGGRIIIQLQGTRNLNRSQIVSGLLECFLNRFSKQKCLSFFFFKPVQLTCKLCLLNKKRGISCLISKKRHVFRLISK